MDTNAKYEKLKAYLSDLGSVAVAFSSGVEPFPLCGITVLSMRR